MLGSERREASRALLSGEESRALLRGGAPDCCKLIATHFSASRRKTPLACLILSNPREGNPFRLRIESLNGCRVRCPNTGQPLYEVQMAMITLRIAPGQSRDLTLLIVRM